MLRNITKICNNAKLNSYSFSKLSSSCIVNKSFISLSQSAGGKEETSFKINYLKSSVALNKKGEF